MMVLLMSDAFVAGHGRAPASRVRTAQLLMRELFFSELDERRAVAFLQQWPKRRFRDGVNTWGNAEWQLFGLPSQLEFTSEPLPNGVRLAYYLSEEGRRRAGLSGLRSRAFGQRLGVCGDVTAVLATSQWRHRNPQSWPRRESVIELAHRKTLAYTLGRGQKTRDRLDLRR